MLVGVSSGGSQAYPASGELFADAIFEGEFQNAILIEVRNGALPMHQDALGPSIFPERMGPCLCRRRTWRS